MPLWRRSRLAHALHVKWLSLGRSAGTHAASRHTLAYTYTPRIYFYRPPVPPIPTPPPGDLTRHLRAAQQGDAEAADALWDAVYGELYRMARGQLDRNGAGHTLNTTALVHEAYLKLVRHDVAYEGRAHFFSVAAKAMRHIVIDHARRKGSQKRGGDLDRVPLEGDHLQVHQRADLLLDLDAALDRLATVDERLAHVVEYRFFAGLELSDVAELLDVSVPTISRDWRKAKAWLAHELHDASQT